MIHLSRRLLCIASMVSEGSKPVDVGCDHGYIPIYLVQKKVSEKVLAMDINEGPLERAGENIEKFGLSDSIELRLSDGLGSYHKGEADCLIIAGMGGLLIRDILRFGHEQGVLEDFRELVLSPHSDIDAVRRLLHTMDFMIDKEDMVYDYGKYYTVIHAVKGKEHYEHSYEYIYGKRLIEEGNPVFIQYLKHLLEKKERRYKSLCYAHTAGASSYKTILHDEVQLLQHIYMLTQKS